MPEPSRESDTRKILPHERCIDVSDVLSPLLVKYKGNEYLLIITRKDNIYMMGKK